MQVKFHVSDCKVIRMGVGENSWHIHKGYYISDCHSGTIPQKRAGSFFEYMLREVKGKETFTALRISPNTPSHPASKWHA